MRKLIKITNNNKNLLRKLALVNNEKITIK